MSLKALSKEKSMALFLRKVADEIESDEVSLDDYHMRYETIKQRSPIGEWAMVRQGPRVRFTVQIKNTTIPAAGPDEYSTWD